MMESRVPLKDRLNEALVMNHKKAADIERDLKIPKSAVSQYCSGKSKAMAPNRLEAICEYLHVSEPWMLGFHVPMSNSQSFKDRNPKEVFACNLQKYMQMWDLSQKDIAQIAGVAFSTVSDWILAKTFPRIQKIEILAAYFGILKSDLIENNSNNQNSMKLLDSDLFIRRYEELIERLHIDDNFRELILKISTLSPSQMELMKCLLKELKTETEI